VAVISSQGEVFLVNASPDLPAQIGSCADLQPNPATLRGTPLAGVLLTNADLDHVAGLLALREGGRLRVHATTAVRATLDGCLGMTRILDAFCGVDWMEPAFADFAPLPGSGGGESPLACRAIKLPGGPPVFATDSNAGGVHCVAYCFLDRETGGRLLVAPDVGGWNEELRGALAESDAVLFDGTFWSDDELQRVKAGARTAEQMGHVTIREQSLSVLGSLSARHRIYIHINNTNPVLSPGSLERAAVEAAGLAVGCDGLEFAL
jgi:pyrroloquinoline quinone biosynthesis protein B